MGKYTLDKMWVLFCQRLTAPQSCVISEWGVRTNCITLTYQMIGFFFREKIAFFQKIDASEESCQTKRRIFLIHWMIGAFLAKVLTEIL